MRKTVSIVPPPPSVSIDGARTTLPVSAWKDVSNEVIERELTDCYGIIQVFDDVITRDLPECHTKSAVAVFFLVLIGPYASHFSWQLTSGTDGTKFSNGQLLSPDLSVWTRERKYTAEVANHLYCEGPSPNFVFECEWIQECDQEKKGHDKILNYYLNNNCFGTLVNDIPT